MSPRELFFFFSFRLLLLSKNFPRRHPIVLFVSIPPVTIHFHSSGSSESPSAISILSFDPVAPCPTGFQSSTRLIAASTPDHCILWLFVNRPIVTVFNLSRSSQLRSLRHRHALPSLNLFLSYRSKIFSVWHSQWSILDNHASAVLLSRANFLFVRKSFDPRNSNNTKYALSAHATRRRAVRCFTAHSFPACFYCAPEATCTSWRNENNVIRHGPRTHKHEK